MNLTDGVPYHAFDLMDRVELNTLEIGFIVDMVAKNPVKENEIAFIKNATKISAGYENYFVVENDHWAYHPKEISEGTYPLEFLPEHVRELAKELYYQ